MPDKATLRKQFAAYRRALSDEEYQEKSAAIVANVQTLPALAQARTVHAYWPRTEAREVDVRPLLRTLHAEGKTLVLPRVTHFGPPPLGEPRLAHLEFAGEEHLRFNRWGLGEPDATPPVSPDALDIVLIPALGAGRDGHRIGHGFGYYDEFLRETPAVKIGLVYEACLVDTIPHEAHDVPLDFVVCERDVIGPISLQPNGG